MIVFKRCTLSPGLIRSGLYPILKSTPHFKPDSLSRRSDYSLLDEPSNDIPFSILRPENFCALSSISPSINDKILSCYKTDKFYIEFCSFFENNLLPSPHPLHDHFSLSNKFLLFDNNSIFFFFLQLFFI